MDETPIINIKDVRFRWPGRTSFSITIPAFAIQPKEKILLLGDSGSGKSTLLSLICGTISAQQGVLEVDGVNLDNLSRTARDRFRAEHIGLIFQQFNLLPFGSVSDNILLPLQFAPKRRNRCGDKVKDAEALCAALGLPHGIGQQPAAQLSVGQQQRVAAARAFIGSPPILVADEPTSALDENAQARFLDLLFDQVDKRQSTLLLVSHNPRLTERFDRVVKMSDIAIIESDMP